MEEKVGNNFPAQRSKVGSPPRRNAFQSDHAPTPLLTALCAFATGLFAAEPQLVLHDGDRVLLIGDVLMERENNFGYLETKMRREFPAVTLPFAT